jgi:hypothetical protein
MRVVLPNPDSPAAIRGRKEQIPSIHLDMILTDDHDCEVSAAFGDNSVPLRKRTSERRATDAMAWTDLVGQVRNTNTGRHFQRTRVEIATK